MKLSEAKTRATKLRDQINEYRYNYHVLNRSIMSEEAADSLKHELAQIESEYPELITPDSPTQRVAGQPLAKFSTVAHQSSMLSLNDVFDQAEIAAWAERISKLEPTINEYYVEMKMDGLAASLVYEDGRFVQGLTRGDGFTGEDVTANLRTIESVPLELRHDASVPASVYRGRFEVRGEVLLYKTDFAALNARQAELGKPLFANTRNTAAGTIRQLDPRLVAARKLRFQMYALATELDGITLHSQEHELASKVGFPVDPNSRIVHSVGEVMEVIGNWKEKRHDLPYGTDGLVITVNNLASFRRLGVVGKAPRGAVAYKFAAEQSTTKLKDIQISIGRTGAATPFAVLEPVVIAGSTVQMATLHNENEIKRKDIRIGDTVIVQKAGDVIPEIVEPLPKLRTGQEKVFKMPKKCPICNTELVKTNKEAVWRCPNFNCSALERGRIIHFGSKVAFDIEGLGESTVDALLDSKLIADAADLFNLTVGDVAGMPRFAQKSAENLIDGIKARKAVSLDRYIYALGIRHVGAQTAVDLARHFGSLENFEASTTEDLAQIPGIGEVVAASVIEWLHEPRSQKLLAKLKTVGVTATPLKTTQGKLTGQAFVITGALEAFSREEAAAQIKALGGQVQTSVTRDTTCLVVGADPGDSKLAKASKLGTRQISESELLRLLNN